MIFELEASDVSLRTGAVSLGQRAGATPQRTVTHRASQTGVAPAPGRFWAALFGVVLLGAMPFLFLMFGAFAT